MSTARPLLAATHREFTGKAVAHLRRDGQLPGVLFGHGVDSTSVTVDTREFEQLRRHAGANMLIDLSIDGKKHLLRDLDCEICPACGDITFTHAQSLEVDKKRIALEFGVKPLLSPEQLKILRRVLNMKLEEICDLLHIGRNTYGRWERGEVDITPSMNLLVHNLIEKDPDARVNLMEIERIVSVEQANVKLLVQYISFVEYIREAIAATRILPNVVCTSI